MSCLDAQTWAKVMFENCELGDLRRTKRLVKVAAKVAANPSGSFPDQMETWGDLKALYRLLDAEDVTFTGIAAPHWQRTRCLARGRTLVLCDTTDLDFGCQRQIEGVGPTGNGSGRGFLLHNAVMVNAGTMSILGVAGQVIHYRPEKPYRQRGEQRSTRLKRKRESEIWGDVIDQIGPPAEDVEFVYVCDRGADNFEVFCHLQQQKSQWVIRAKDLTRRLVTSTGEHIPLSEVLDQLTPLGTYNLNLRARPNQPARTAKIEVSSGCASMPVPVRKSAWLKSMSPQPITMNIIRVREVDAPRGVAPIEWVLYTSLPVDTFAQVWDVIEYYEARWLVEEYHKALKTGTSVTRRQLENASRLEAMVGLMSVVAVRLLQLKTLARTEPDRLARTVVPPLWLQMLKAARKRLRRVHDLTIYEFYRELAKLGGFLGRKSDGEPGWLTIWRGWEKLNTMVRGAELILQSKSQKCG